jgi:Asp-tRNA(Asn)/Glu-tRNA(Gln) amidotransferase A subunit family amidase
MPNSPAPPRTIAELSQAIERGELDPRDLARGMLDRAAGPDKRLNCFVLLCRDAALAEAQAAAERALSGRRKGPLDGIPIAVKDNIDVAGLPTGNGFGGPPWRVPREDAEVVRRLRDAGAVVLGKLNMHEGALGGTTDNPHTGRTHNPHRDGYTPGGSSGGSGAAVAAGLCCAALGTDSGGSIRIPAAYCGVVGLKPSWGLVSSRGVVPLAPRLDHVGPLARNVADAALVFEAIRGFDPLCPDSRRVPEEVQRLPPGGRLDGVRLGTIANFAAETTAPAIETAFAAALARGKALGATVRSLTLPSYDLARARRALLLRMEVEAAALWDAVARDEPAHFSPQFRGWLEYGEKVAATRLLAAERLADIAAFELDRCFDEVDAILSPATPQPAFPFDMPAPDNQNSFAALANFAGCPALSLPMGTDPSGLPLGLQVMGRRDTDAFVLRIAAALEGG